mmetsp:Transcript_50843/g.82199  ORF Transcript_50843/g.82199 Transcript_50843/m.82199 type:complete len:349 (+) Transcript_50843:54-1100(+)
MDMMADQSPLVPSNPADALVKAPGVAKGLAGVTILLYAMGQLIPGLESVLAIKATNTYGAHSYIWNVFTAGFFNNSIVLALVMAIAFLVMGRFLVPAWGSIELLRFMFFANLFTGIIIFFSQIIYYMCTFNYKYLEAPISGGWPLLAAFLVTIKQRLPDEMLAVNGQPLGALCARDLPAILVLVAAGLSFFGVAPIFIQSVCGAYFGWLYLRFLQRAGGGMRGDQSEHMAFIVFFPPALRPLMQVVSSFAHKAVCGKTMQMLLDDLPLAHPSAVAGLPPGVFRGGFTGLVSDSAPPSNIPAPPLPGSDQADAERRRARALKSLEERLRSISQPAGDDGSVAPTLASNP